MVHAALGTLGARHPGGDGAAISNGVGPLPIWSLHVYGSSDGRWTVEYQVSIGDDGVLGVTGLLTWDTWTVEQLREATPDEAEMLTHRTTGIL